MLGGDTFESQDDGHPKSSMTNPLGLLNYQFSSTPYSNSHVGRMSTELVVLEIDFTISNRSQSLIGTLERASGVLKVASVNFFEIHECPPIIWTPILKSIENLVLGKFEFQTFKN